MGYKWVPTSSFATETSSRLCFVQFCLSGGVVIGNPAETEPPTYEVEQVGPKLCLGELDDLSGDAETPHIV